MAKVWRDANDRRHPAQLEFVHNTMEQHSQFQFQYMRLNQTVLLWKLYTSRVDVDSHRDADL